MKKLVFIVALLSAHSAYAMEITGNETPRHQSEEGEVFEKPENILEKFVTNEKKLNDLHFRRNVCTAGIGLGAFFFSKTIPSYPAFPFLSSCTKLLGTAGLMGATSFLLNKKIKTLNVDQDATIESIKDNSSFITYKEKKDFYNAATKDTFLKTTGFISALAANAYLCSRNLEIGSDAHRLVGIISSGITFAGLGYGIFYKAPALFAAYKEKNNALNALSKAQLVTAPIQTLEKQPDLQHSSRSVSIADEEAENTKRVQGELEKALSGDQKEETAQGGFERNKEEFDSLAEHEQQGEKTAKTDSLPHELKEVVVSNPEEEQFTLNVGDFLNPSSESECEDGAAASQNPALSQEEIYHSLDEGKKKNRTASSSCSEESTTSASLDEGKQSPRSGAAKRKKRRNRTKDNPQKTESLNPSEPTANTIDQLVFALTANALEEAPKESNSPVNQQPSFADIVKLQRSSGANSPLQEETKPTETLV